MVSDYTLEQLHNNLRVLTIPMDTASVTVLLLIGAGSRYEEKEEGGISHFLEHMAFKGTKKRPVTRMIAQEIEGMGGVFNAYTAKEYTGYWMKAQSKHMPKMLDILSDMLLSSLYKTEEINREKGVIIEEINMYEDSPIRKVGEVYEYLLYDDTPLGRDIAGTKGTVSSFTRRNFLSYMQKLYAPGNAVLVLAGGGVTDSKSLAEKFFGSWQNHEVTSYEKAVDVQSKPASRIVTKKTEQTHLCVGVRAFSRNDPRRYILNLLTVILGGGMSSRLFTEVRERRGLAYYVKSDVDRFHDVGYFVTQAGVETKKMEEATKVILEEYKKIQSSKFKVQNTELKRAKEYVKGNFILSLEDSQAVATVFANSALLEDKIRTPQQILDGIDKVTVSEVTELARELFVPERLNFAAIGPFEKGIEKKLEKVIQL
ncbi:insulinase family protein [Candidatus Roizmanbacteria bacterium]|nr:insulinase family protein [Candidatus Roizmanbacteria bacterium]